MIPEKCLQIKTTLSEQDEETLVVVLKDNIKSFTSIAAKLPDIHPRVACHKLRRSSL